MRGSRAALNSPKHVPSTVVAAQAELPRRLKTGVVEPGAAVTAPALMLVNCVWLKMLKNSKRSCR